MKTKTLFGLFDTNARKRDKLGRFTSTKKECEVAELKKQIAELTAKLDDAERKAEKYRRMYEAIYDSDQVNAKRIYEIKQTLDVIIKTY